MRYSLAKRIITVIFFFLVYTLIFLIIFLTLRAETKCIDNDNTKTNMATITLDYNARSKKAHKRNLSIQIVFDEIMPVSYPTVVEYALDARCAIEQTG